jgi:hypothetical protein
MNLIVQLVPLLVPFAYLCIQTFRDTRGRNYVMAVWGGLLSLMMLGAMVMLPRISPPT